jgi:hypothetical protein
MIASTSTGADAVPADVVPPAVGAAFVAGAALVTGAGFVTGAAFGAGAARGVAAAPGLVGFADPLLPTAALLASVTLSQIFPKMLTRRLAVLG